MNNNDVIENLANELRKKHNFHKLQHKIADILINKGIIEKNSQMECGYINRNTPECAFGCKILPENNKLNGKKIEIIVKPDHSLDKEGHRMLRVLISIGEGKEFKIFEKCEDENKEGKNIKRVFRRELRDIINDIKKFLKKAA
jgi:hypothetical protein